MDNDTRRSSPAVAAPSELPADRLSAGRFPLFLLQCGGGSEKQRGELLPMDSAFFRSELSGAWDGVTLFGRSRTQ